MHTAPLTCSLRKSCVEGLSGAAARQQRQQQQHQAWERRWGKRSANMAMAFSHAACLASCVLHRFPTHTHTLTYLTPPYPLNLPTRKTHTLILSHRQPYIRMYARTHARPHTQTYTQTCVDPNGRSKKKNQLLSYLPHMSMHTCMYVCICPHTHTHTPLLHRNTKKKKKNQIEGKKKKALRLTHTH